MPVPRATIVDDDPGFGEFVRKLAERCGYDARLVQDGASFEAECAAPWPDVILLDLKLAGTDGTALLGLLAERGCPAPILMMSGTDARTVEQARALGAARGLRMDRVLTKPFRAADLAGILTAIKRGDG